MRLLPGLALLPLPWLLVGCGDGAGGFRPLEREDPALSGDGRLLATLVSRAGQPMVLLQEQSSGRILPLRHLRGQPPHSSPSLSWNGRYLAVLAGQGQRRWVLIEDRASGRLHRLPLPPDLEPERLSLSPEARRLAIEARQEGRVRIRLFALAGQLEPDLPAGLAVQGGAPGTLR